MIKVLLIGIVFGVVLGKWVDGSEISEDLYSYGTIQPLSPLLVKLTLIPSARAKGAVCLDGTLPGYHWSKGFGRGENSWIIQIEGGGWCNDVNNCVSKKKTPRGSSKFMEKKLAFTGILSNKPEENPEFYNWNRVKLRYCDGASFTGDTELKESKLQFRGQRIWEAAMEELMLKGMKLAKQVLLSGCSAGGLASIIHCDEFKGLFPKSTTVKCMSDAGLFLDVLDVSGQKNIRKRYSGVVELHELKNNLPKNCTDHLDPTSCFFPQNIIGSVNTPLFILNAAYDSWQISQSLVPKSADRKGLWKGCKNQYANCTASQIEILQGFRNKMLSVLKNFSNSPENGLFINSCFTHCQTEIQDSWFAPNSTMVNNKRIAVAVADWYFERERSKTVDRPYPSNKSCKNTIVK